MHRKGKGVSKDDAEAVHWYRKAAKQGLADAQYNLGLMYHNGEGVPRNYAESVRWWRKSAEQGYAKSQYGLGLMYDKGKGVSRDYIEAYKWFNLAAAQGIERAATLRDRLQRDMTPSQIAQAQARSRQWRPISDAGN